RPTPFPYTTLCRSARQSPILGLDSPGRPGCDEVGYAGQRPEIGELVASCGTVGDDDDGFAGFGRGADEAQSRQHRERGPEYDDPPRPLADAVRLLQPGRWDRIAEVDHIGFEHAAAFGAVGDDESGGVLEFDVAVGCGLDVDGVDADLMGEVRVEFAQSPLHPVPIDQMAVVEADHPVETAVEIDDRARGGCSGVR